MTSAVNSPPLSEENDSENQIMTRSRANAILLGSLLTLDGRSSTIAQPLAPQPLPSPQIPLAPQPLPSCQPQSVSRPLPSSQQLAVSSTRSLSPVIQPAVSISLVSTLHNVSPPIVTTPQVSRPVLPLPSLTPSPASSFLLNPDSSVTGHLRISPQTITSTNPNIFAEMSRPLPIDQSNQEALFPEPTLDDDDGRADSNINDSVFHNQPSTSCAAPNTTVLIVDDPQNVNLPREDAGESRYNFRETRGKNYRETKERNIKRKNTKPDSTEKPAKQRFPSPSMTDIYSKVNTCARQAQTDQTDFESGLMSSLEIVSNFVPKQESDDDLTLSSDDDSILQRPKASTPK